MTDTEYKNESLPIASINRTVQGASVKDICNVLEYATKDTIESSYRNILTRQAIEEIDVGISSIEKYVSFAYVKFTILAFLSSSIFTLGYFFAGWNPVANLASWGLVGCAFFGLIVGGFFANVFDSGILYGVFRRVLGKVGHNLLTDFAKVFDFSQDGEPGAWRTARQVVNTIEEKTGRKYDVLDVFKFLEGWEHATKKVQKEKTLYYLKLA